MLLTQRILVDAVEHLITALNGLFSRIYDQVKVPGQWLVYKTIPVFKNKGNKKDRKLPANIEPLFHMVIRWHI